MNITEAVALADREIDAALAAAGNNPALLALPRDKLIELFLLEMGIRLEEIAQAMRDRPARLN